MSPVRAILLHSPGRKPWVIIVTHLLSPKGAALFCLRQMLVLLVPLLVGAQSAFVCVYPGFPFGLCPHFTLGYAGVSCQKALVISLIFDAVSLHTNISNNCNIIACMQIEGKELFRPFEMPCLMIFSV